MEPLMEDNMQRDVIKWRNLEIEVLFDPDYTPVFREIYGHALGHLQIRCLNGKPMPISETGYKSHFDRTYNIEAEGGAAAYVRAWLDHAAQENGRGGPEADPRQLALF